MRTRALILAAGAACALTGVANAQVYTAGGLPLPINDNVTFTSILNVPDSFSITDLNIIFKATHTFRGDVDLALVRGSNYIVLSTDNGGGGDNFSNVRFDQQAAASITASGTANNLVGTFRPEGTTGSFATQGFGLAHQTAAFGALGRANTDAVTSLDFWNGTDAQGDWTLLVSDDAGGDTGSLTYWSIEFNGAADPEGPPPPAPPPPAFSGSFVSTPLTLAFGQTLPGTTIYTGSEPGITDGAGEGSHPYNVAFGAEFTNPFNEVAYRIDHLGGGARFDLTDLSTDVDLYLLDSTGLPANGIYSSTNGGSTAEVINLGELPAGTYFLVVDGFSGDSNFNISYQIPAPSAAALLGLGLLAGARRRRA